MQPTYELTQFVADCVMGILKAYVPTGAMESARSDFNLNKQEDVLQFIGNGGLEHPQFINSKPWENNPDKNTEIMVDAYAFCTGLLYGYIAFFFQTKTNKWIIKSFKKNEQPDPRNLAFKSLRTQLLEDN